MTTRVGADRRVARAQVMRVDERCRTLATNQPDTGSLEMADELLLLVQLVDGALGGDHQRREIQRRGRCTQPIVGKLLGVAHQARGLGQDASRGAAVIGTCAAGPVALDERHARAKLGAAQRRGHPGRPATDDDQLEGPFCLAHGGPW